MAGLACMSKHEEAHNDEETLAPSGAKRFYKPYSSLTWREKALVEVAARSGDSGAIDSIIVGHAPLVGSIVYAKMSSCSLEAMQDAVSVINFRIAQKIHLYKPVAGASVTSWIHALAIRQTYSILRTHRSRRVRERHVCISQGVEEVGPQCDSHVERLHRADAWQSFLLSLTDNELEWVSWISREIDASAHNRSHVTRAKRLNVDVNAVREKAIAHGLRF